LECGMWNKGRSWEDRKVRNWEVKEQEVERVRR
jgi:hypothetical protein